jgi:hypothetical protein
LIAACNAGRSTSVIPAVPAAWSVTTIACIAHLPNPVLAAPDLETGKALLNLKS